jgi:hypothetical protein
MHGMESRAGADKRSHWQDNGATGPAPTRATSAVPWIPLTGASLVGGLIDRKGTQTVRSAMARDRQQQWSGDSRGDTVCAVRRNRLRLI